MLKTKQRIRSNLILCFLVGLLCWPQIARAESFTYTTISVPGATQTSASAINNVGQIVGNYRDSTGAWHGYVYTNGTFTNFFDVPGVNPPAPIGISGINDAGQIVGSIGGPGGKGFLYSDGVFTDIYYPQGFSTSANGINNAGQILVGIDFVGSFVLSNGELTPIIVPGISPMLVQASGINNIGQVVGSFGFSDDLQGFLQDTNGDVTTFRFPGAVETHPSGINDFGEIVGYYRGTGGPYHGFIYRNGDFTPFDEPLVGSFLGTQTREINNAGQIVGTFTDASGRIQGFLATPVPEPTSLLLLVSGIAAAGLLLRHRNASQLKVCVWESRKVIASTFLPEGDGA
jgi:probable HAF family extracellular repeat protein